MDVKTNYSPEEFAQLAKTDTLAWVEAFRNADVHCTYIEVREMEDVCAVEVNGCHIVCVHSEGGYEGAGEDVSRVFSINRGNEMLAHFRTTGCYDSHNGTEWDDQIEVVYPRNVTVTQYFTTP